MRYTYSITDSQQEKLHVQSWHFKLYSENGVHSDGKRVKISSGQ